MTRKKVECKFEIAVRTLCCEFDLITTHSQRERVASYPGPFKRRCKWEHRDMRAWVRGYVRRVKWSVLVSIYMFICVTGSEKRAHFAQESSYWC